MNSYEIVMFRTLIGSLLLIILYLATNHRFTFYKHKKSFAFLALSASVYVLIRLVGALCIIAGAVGAELKQTQNPMPSSHQGKHRVFHYLLHLLWRSPLFILLFS